MMARPTAVLRSAPGALLADHREVVVAAAIMAAGVSAFAAYVGPRAPAPQAFASCLVFAALFAPVAGLGVAAWVDRLTLWLSPAPVLRAGALFMAGVAVVTVHAVAF